MGISKLAKSKQLLGAIVAAVLLTVIFVPFQPANAFTVTVDLPEATGSENEVTASLAGTPFEIDIDVVAGELISIDTIELILDNGEESVNYELFNFTGEFLGGHTDGHLVVDNELTITTDTDSGYAYGFGLISEGITNEVGYAFVFDNETGFIGGNDQGSNSNAGGTEFVTGLLGPGTITINGTLITSDLEAGIHTLDVLIQTGAGGDFVDQLSAPTLEFDIVEDDSIVVEETFVDENIAEAQVVTTDSDGNDIIIEFFFGQNSTEDGNIEVIVQSVADFIDAYTEEELEAQGLEDVGGQLQFTTDDPDTTFIAAGFVLDIDLAELELPEGTLVTLNMTYFDDGLTEEEEESVRILHKIDNTAEWEALTNDNATINGGDEVDIVNKFVYGSTDDFSLFSPAVEAANDDGDDGDDDAPSGGGGGGGSRTVTITWPTVTTLPDSHFINYPLDRIQVANSAFVNAGGVSIDAAQVNQQVSISGEFTNFQSVAQSYAFIVQVTDENGFVTDIAWQQGTLESGSTADVSTLWTPDNAGTYKVQIFVWNSISAMPEPLSEATVKNISVSE